MKSLQMGNESAACKQRNFRNTIIPIVAVTYLFTGVGGWLAHSREIFDSAQRLYTKAEVRNAENFALEGRNYIELLPNGPKSQVNWCIPILPGILLVDSHYVVGPLFAKGGAKIVVFYGWGSFTLWELWGWIS